LDAEPESSLNDDSNITQTDPADTQTRQPSQQFQVAATRFSTQSLPNRASFRPESRASSSVVTSDSDSGKTGLSSLDAVRLVLGDTRLILASGEVKPLPVWGEDEFAVKTKDIGASLDCIAAENVTGIIKVFSACQIAGLSPGKTQLQARYTTPAGLLLLSSMVDVEVVPKLVAPVNGVVDIVVNDWQEELWLSFPQLLAGAFYRITMLSVAGGLPFRSAIEVTPDFSDINKVCRNTLPVDADRVACYFYAQNNPVTILVSNAARAQFQARLVVESVQEKAQYAVSYSPFAAKPIFINSVERHYVFANEVGQNNAHFFRFQQNTKPARPVRVTLFNYTYPVWLNVSWGKRVCTKEMMSITATSLSCTILTDDANDVLIEVDGNNRLELMNAPAAVDGGTPYSLLLEYM